MNHGPPIHFCFLSAKARAAERVRFSRIPEISRNPRRRWRESEHDQGLGDRSCTFRENFDFGAAAIPEILLLPI
jgi:hypothetical protein